MQNISFLTTKFITGLRFENVFRKSVKSPQKSHLYGKKIVFFALLPMLCILLNISRL